LQLPDLPRYLEVGRLILRTTTASQWLGDAPEIEATRILRILLSYICQL
jgi:hypothetical protein